jgi:Fe-S-cluster containining protein
MSAWYADGLRFACTRCGNCCTGPGGYVWLTERDEEGLAAHLGLTRDEFRRRYARLVGTRLSLVDKPNGDCVFLTAERGCGVQAAKPRQCVTYPFWPRITATRDAWAAEGERCPGIGKGPRYRPEEIDAVEDGETPREVVCRIFARARETP